MLKVFLISILFFCIFSSLIKAEDYELNIIEQPKEILIEIGWMKYFNVVVKNTGTSRLNNVSIYFDGEFPQWLEVQNNNIELLQPNNNLSFLVKLNVPSSVEPKVYSFTLYANSKEVKKSQSFSVRIFKTKTDIMLYQAQNLEIEIEDLQRNITKAKNLGKDITSVTNSLNEVKDLLETTKNYIKREDYEKASKLMIDVESSIEKIAFDLSVAPPITNNDQNSGFSFEWFIMPIVIILIVIAIIIFYILKKRKKENIIKTPVVKIKEMVLEGNDVKNLENEMQEVENSKKLLEEEFKENLISKESYDELKAKYEKKIADLRNEIERNKKIE